MGLFKKQHETITISATDQASAVSLYGAAKAAKFKNTTFSQLVSNGETYQFSIQCADAETISNSMLHLLYACNNPDLFEMMVQFEDKSGKAKFFPKELLVSFRLDSGLPFGDEREQEFVARLKKTVSADTKAAVDYVIMGGGAITMAIPSSEPENTHSIVGSLFEAHPITSFEINIISRESA